MQEYQVTVTYLVSVDAESEDTAEQLALEYIKGGWEPNDIEVEEQMTPFQEMKQGLKEAIDFVTEGKQL